MERAKILVACDAAAESLVLLDQDDSGSIAELTERLDALAAVFGAAADSVHPAASAARTAHRFALSQEPGLLATIEEAFLAARALAERLGTAGSGAKAASKPKQKKSKPVPPDDSAAAAFPLSGDEELLRDFAIRASEHLDDADEHLLILEADGSDPDAIDAVFRAFHTIKGMAGFLALDDISEHSHASENMLSDARTAGTTVTGPAIQQLFASVDRMRTLIAQATGIINESSMSVSEFDTAPLPAAGVPDDASTPVRKAATSGAQQNGSSRSGMVRIEEARLDALLDTIGELVIAESMVSAGARSDTTSAASDAQVERLDKITRELQHMATSLRMVPLKATFRRMARLVRDLSHKAGKPVEFVTRGEDTEMDKSVVDKIQDPLIHALRNAVDHGVESPEERRAAGKPATARVELRAYHAGGSIHVEVSDDGAGLNPERILARARERGLIGADEHPDDRALYDLVFEPGFSTAQEVTDVSGRGVGMDVVRRTVEELRGRIEVTSIPGKGMTMSVKLPVTLAIIDGMIARIGEERFVIPVLAIERSVRPEPEALTTVRGKGLMLTTDEGLVPILKLHDFLDISGGQTDPTQAVVVIINESGVRAGLLVCELLGQQQTVIKPLGDGLPDQMGVAGGAIMSDGRVGLILDASGLVRLASAERTD